MIVAENRGFRQEIIWDFFSLIWDFFAIFCQASRYRARFQASSGHSDSANRPGYEAAEKANLEDLGRIQGKDIIAINQAYLIISYVIVSITKCLNLIGSFKPSFMA